MKNSFYKVLLVDDEEDVIHAIMKKLEWEALGFQIVGYARNGIEALEMAEELAPDVVMTDIKMPYMDGLALSHKLKEEYGNIRIIIFSGFDEFEYAREAIKIEAEQYILKPIDSGELQEVFQRTKASLDLEREEKRDKEKLQEYYLQSLPLLQDNFYTSLLEGRIPEEEVFSLAENYRIPLTGPSFVATVFHISFEKGGEKDGNLSGEWKREENPLLGLMALKQLCEEYLADSWNQHILLFAGNLVMITQLEAEKIHQFTDTMDRVCKAAKRICNLTVTAGIGGLCDMAVKLEQSYQGARSAASYRVLYGTMRAINIQEIAPKESGGPDKNGDNRRPAGLLKEIRMGKQDGLKREVEHFAKELFRSGISLAKFRNMLLSLVAELYRFMEENRIPTEEIFGDDADIYSMALQYDTEEAMFNWLFAHCARMQDFLANNRQDATQSFVSKAREYVKENFGDSELNIEVICKYLNVSSAYFSTVFKKETGKTFINYLTDYRMEHAALMLLESDRKTYEVAEAVGYSDSNYFSYVFKKQYGISPTKYRVSQTGEK